MSLRTSSPVLLNTTSPSRSISVSIVGDSIAALNNPNNDLAVSTPAAIYVNPNRTCGPKSWLAQGAMRSKYAWFPFELFGCKGGGHSTDVISSCIPLLLNSPFGLPDACIVLIGHNDGPSGLNLTVAQMTANLKTIYNTLLASGITPIPCTLTPVINGDMDWTQQINWAIIRLAKEYGVPCIDFYSALAGPDGRWASPFYTYDGTHPTDLGAAIMGYAMQPLTSWLTQGNRTTFLWQNSGTFTDQTPDPNFQVVTGTVNSSSSRPTQFNALGTPAMGTVFSSAGSEPGGTKTMLQTLPAILGLGGLPQYVGNSFSLAGNGTNTAILPGPSFGGAVPAGNKIAFRARIKLITINNTTKPCDYFIGLYDNNVGALLTGVAGSLFGYGHVDGAGVATITITAAGSGGANGTYTFVPLSGGSGNSGVYATIVISGGVITQATITVAGTGYVVGDILSTNIGGLSGVQLTVATIQSDTAPIGNETAYPAGDFYSEYTVTGAYNGLQVYFGIRNNQVTPTSNTGDSITIANVMAKNLTTNSLILP